MENTRMKSMIVNLLHHNNTFKHITAGFWERKLGTGIKGNTVWAKTTDGEVLVANCFSNVSSMITQQANAKLIALAPDMYMVLEDIKKHGLDANAKRGIDYIFNRMSLPNE
jgi:hypothetical protein